MNNMLVNYRDYGSLAYKPMSDPNEIHFTMPEKKRQQKSPAPRNEIQRGKSAALSAAPVAKSHKVAKLMIVVYVFVFFATVGFIVSRYAAVASVQSDLLAVKTSLKQQTSVNEDLSVQLSLANDMGIVQSRAREELGMDFPKPDQIVYLNLPETQNPAAGAETTEQAVQQQTEAVEPGLWQRILSLLD